MEIHPLKMTQQSYTCCWLRNMFGWNKELHALKASVILTHWLKKFTYFHWNMLKCYLALSRL
jgi:hypothetical protein